MKSKHMLTTILLILSTISTFSQVLTAEESKLYGLLMAYRNEKGLSEIPLSRSLTVVAQTHVKDLSENNPDGVMCNAHSWSSHGSWSACCYTPDHAKAACMWAKPRELTSYVGNGYEIVCWNSGKINANSALAGWKSSPKHNAVILNSGIWKDQWNAIGIGIYNGYAAVWFGKEVDAK